MLKTDNDHAYFVVTWAEGKPIQLGRGGCQFIGSSLKVRRDGTEYHAGSESFASRHTLRDSRGVISDTVMVVGLKLQPGYEPEVCDAAFAKFAAMKGLRL